MNDRQPPEESKKAPLTAEELEKLPSDALWTRFSHIIQTTFPRPKWQEFTTGKYTHEWNLLKEYLIRNGEWPGYHPAMDNLFNEIETTDSRELYLLTLEIKKRVKEAMPDSQSDRPAD